MNKTEEIILQYSDRIQRMEEMNRELCRQNMELIRYIREMERLTQVKRLYGSEARHYDERKTHQEK